MNSGKTDKILGDETTRQVSGVLHWHKKLGMLK
jgi:hypothetical protein